MKFWDKASGTAAGEVSDAFAHAEQQLQTQSDACVPSEREDADVTRHDGRPQEVLHRRGAVRVPIEHLRRKERD